MNAQGDIYQWLTRAADRGFIHVAQIDQLQVHLAGLDVPLPHETLPPTTDADIQSALVDLLALRIRREKVQNLAADDLLDLITAWKLRTLLAVHEEVQTEHEKKHASLAALLAAGTLSIAGWQRGMRESIIAHNLEQALLGSRGKLSHDQRNEILQASMKDMGYLERFADELAARKAAMAPMTEWQIRSRSNLYTAAGRGLFWRNIERSAQHALNEGNGRGFGMPPGPENRTDPTYGWVVLYVAVDDTSTCKACHNAQGYYLPGTGPYPGEVCAGRAHCRCQRNFEYNVDAYDAIRRGERQIRA